jgi:hypothetical protein
MYSRQVFKVDTAFFVMIKVWGQLDGDKTSIKSYAEKGDVTGRDDIIPGPLVAEAVATLVDEVSLWRRR